MEKNIIYVKQTSGELTTDKINVVPIVLRTPIKLLAKNDTGVSFHKMDELDGSFLYIDKNNQLTKEAFTVVSNDKEFSPNSAKIKIGNIDNLPGKIDGAEFIDNNKFIEEANLFIYEYVNKDNSFKFNIVDILSKEMRNLLEKSTFEFSVFDFLDRVNWSESGFISANRFDITFSNNQVLKFNLEDLYVEEKLCLYNIPEGVDIKINYQNVELFDNQDGGVLINLPEPSRNIILELINKSGFDISIINPYILFV